MILFMYDTPQQAVTTTCVINNFNWGYQKTINIGMVFLNLRDIFNMTPQAAALTIVVYK